MNFGSLKLLPIAIVVIGLMGITNNVYATEPLVTSFTLQNLDGSDPEYSDGDTLTITFSIDTDLGGFPLNVPVGEANIDDLFGTDPLGNDYDGQWVNARTFVISVFDSTGHNMILGQSIAESESIPIRDAAVPADIWGTDSPTLQLGIVSDNQGGGCDSDCQSPTLGVDKKSACAKFCKLM